MFHLGFRQWCCNLRGRGQGKKVKEGALATGKTQKAGGVMNVAQEQDSVGGGYEAKQAFAGSIT